MTGAAGQVGRALVRLGPAEGVEVVGLDRSALDITDPTAVREAVARARPDVVVNAAAYTAVDRAEAEPEVALRVNRDGARHVAEAAHEAGIPVVHLSTDYVFDGSKGSPYRPDDPVHPINSYGVSKAAGEAAVRETGALSVILRTAWVFDGMGKNFVTTMLRLATQRSHLTVVDDQWGHPTAAPDVARAALAAARRACDGLTGTLHLGGLPVTTWHGLAEATVGLLGELAAVPVPPVDPVPTEAFPTAARRPPRVELDMATTLSALGLPAPDWRLSLREAVTKALQYGLDRLIPL